MNLPTLSTPKYSLTIPSNGKTITYRPFLVKEEKILLIAQESENQTQMINAIKDVIHSCTFGAVDPNKLASYDLEYIFLKLRAKSVGENTNVGLKCTHCSHANFVEINIDDIEPIMPERVDPRVMLTETVGVNLKHMTVQDMTLLSSNKKANAGEIMISTIISHIDSIFDADKIYPAENCSREELEAFVQSLSRSQMTTIEKFISTVPKIEKDVFFKCEKCGENNEIKISGVQSFFE
jgi:RNA polymerase-binding transcription factor DksA